MLLQWAAVRQLWFTFFKKIEVRFIILKYIIHCWLTIDLAGGRAGGI